MKIIRFLTMAFAALFLSATFTTCNYDDEAIWEKANELDNRVTELENLCAQMNDNISALKTLVDAKSNGDVITDVRQLETGYIITFAQHEPIVIYHGKDGKDGKTPAIGVQKDTDGLYYWTLNGEWLTDELGEKVKAQGEKGETGAAGKDGANGITPQLKIENGDWYASLDNGSTWTKLGKATGETGAQGDKGDSIFKSVWQDDENVYFVLADNSVIIIPKNDPDEPNNGYYAVDLGLSVKWATCNIGASKPEEYGSYFAWGETEPKKDYSWETYKYGSGHHELTKYCDNSSYGKNDFIDNKTVLEASDDAAAVNWGGAWRMPTAEELNDLMENCSWEWTTQNGVKGYKVTSKTNDNSIFLPAAGYRYGTKLDNAGFYGYYLGSSLDAVYTDSGYFVFFDSNGYVWNGCHRSYGLTVRPVCE